MVANGFLYTLGEGQTPCYIRFSELKKKVASIAAALRHAGVKMGDRVVGKYDIMNSSVTVLQCTY